MSIKKQYLTSRPVCKATFRIPEEMGSSAKTAHIVGEFNNWTVFSTPMKKLKSGAFTTTLELEPGREYQFRYLLDKKIWKNESDADKSVLTPYGDSENSVIIIQVVVITFGRISQLQKKTTPYSTYGGESNAMSKMQ